MTPDDCHFTGHGCSKKLILTWQVIEKNIMELKHLITCRLNKRLTLPLSYRSDIGLYAYDGWQANIRRSSQDLEIKVFASGYVFHYIQSFLDKELFRRQWR